MKSKPKAAPRRRKTKPKTKPVSLSEFARQLGISRQNLNHHLSNADAPKIGDVDEWVKFLALFGREGSAPPDLRRKIAEARLSLIQEQRERLRLENEQTRGDGEVVSRKLVEKLLQFLGTALAVAAPNTYESVARNVVRLREPREAAQVLKSVGSALAGCVVGFSSGVATEWPSWFCEALQCGFSGKGEPWPEQRLQGFRTLVTHLCGEAGASTRADVENERRSWEERCSSDWDRFSRWKHDLAAEARDRRHRWLAGAAAARTPVSDATDEELAQFPGLRRSA